MQKFSPESLRRLPSLAAVQTELARRQAERAGHNARSATQTLLDFTKYTTPDYLIGWFNQDICRRLDKFLADVAAGKRPRLMIFAPPRHGKSELGSRKLPAYALGRYPDFEVIGASYSADLADSMSADVQRIMSSEAYRVAFPETRLARSGARQAGDENWKRTDDYFQVVGRRGSYRSVGVDVGITGLGGRIVIIDDPVKDANQAASATYREKVWTWYTQTLYSRLEPGAGIILIMTRWHVDDLAGRLLAAQETGGDKWEVVSYPAIAEVDETFRRIGDPLFAARYDLAALQQIRGAVLTYAWSSLYQQRPVPREGALFKMAWFAEKIVDIAPADCIWWRHWDLAASTAQAGAQNQAWTAGVKLGYSPSLKRYYVGDVKRVQEEGDDVRRTIHVVAVNDGRQVKISLPQDPGQAGKVQAKDFIAGLAGFIVKAERETGDKVTRAEPFAAQCQAGTVYLVCGAWNTAYLDELCLFPSSAAKDQVDASSGAFGRLSGGQVIPIVIPFVHSVSRTFP